MEKWKLFTSKNESSIGYQLADGLLVINPQVDSDGQDYSRDASAEEMIQLNSDGSFKFLDEGYNELTQFNCINYLWVILEVINESLSKTYALQKHDLDLNKLLAQKSIFKILSVKINAPDEQGYETNLLFTFEMDGKTYSGKQQFYKYLFLENSLLEKTWTIEKLSNFIVHMMKFSYEQEVKFGSTDFLNIDRSILEVLKKNC